MEELGIIGMTEPSYCPELNLSEYIIRLHKLKIRKRLDQMK